MILELERQTDRRTHRRTVATPCASEIVKTREMIIQQRKKNLL